MAEQALAGVRVLEAAGGVAGAYCGKLFADMGAYVARIEPEGGDPLRTVRLDLDEPATEGLYFHYLNAGKAEVSIGERWDILILGEVTDRDQSLPTPQIATLDITWFGHEGPYADWRGSDLIAQALTAMAYPVGPVEGPPVFPGEHQAALVGGVAAYSAGVAALLGGVAGQVFDISILEAIIINSEMQMCHTITLNMPIQRAGVNRFIPTCPLSIHKCREGWIGVTPLTPAQWQSICDMLGLAELRDDPQLLPSRDRYPHVARIEAAFDSVFPTKTADEWGALGRQNKVPMVVVPDARGILEHPIFNARDSLAKFTTDEGAYRTPRTPFRLEATPPRLDLDAIPTAGAPIDPLSPCEDSMAPLAGIRVLDFSMGWAGPLATRMLSDLGAEVIKIEAGRYPDWWRAVDWSPEAIERGQYEESRHFSVINRGKQSVSLDLTQPAGLALAKQLADKCDIIVENQAAGVMPRLGLGYEQLSEGRDDLIMLSMSAFGSGNDWSETRAYGSVLEQGSGLPSFCGEPDWPPTMGHLAYGDPIGGIYGGASLLTALYHRRRSGQGQWINNTQIEAMLPFTTAPVLIRQATGREPVRRGNRHSANSPHGMFPCLGDDNWLAISVSDDAGWQGLAKLIGWTGDGQTRRADETAIEAAISAWSRPQTREAAASALQALGVAAAPVWKLHEVDQDAHLKARAFFYDVERRHIGQQYQAGLPFRRNGMRYPMRGLAPFLGGDSEAALTSIVGIEQSEFQQLLDTGVVSLTPTQLRGS